MKSGMTEGPEWKCILHFTVPLIIANLLQQLYNIVDGIIVGNFIGQTALSAVGTCGPLTMVFFALAFGMPVGSGIMCAQFFGAKKREDLRQAVSTSVLLMLMLGAVFSVVGILVARVMLDKVMGVPAHILDDAVLYFQIYSVGLIFSFAYNIAASVLRSVGDSSSTLYFLLVAAVTNIGLDLLFVAKFHWGVAGAAWATVISQALSAIVSFIYMNRRYEVLRLKFRDLRFYGDKAKLCVRLGIPTTIQQLVISCGNVAIQRAINGFGEDMIASMTAAIRAYSVLWAPCIAFNTSTSTFAGQNLGAGKVSRAERGAMSASLICCIIALVLGVAAFLGAEKLIGLFGVSGEVCVLGAPYIRVAAAILPISGFYMCISGTYRGAGDVTAATSITVGGLVCRTAATYIMVYCTALGTRSIAFGLLFDLIPTVIVGTLRYWLGPWRTMGLVKEEA